MEKLSLPGTPAEKQAVLDELALHEPELVKRWLMQHPRNLMVYDGLAVEDFHNDGLADLLEFKRTFWLAPRGSGKSTVLAYAAAWLCIADPAVYTEAGIPYLFEGAPRRIDPSNIRIAITTNSADKAIAICHQVRGILLSDRLALLFGDLAGRRWKDSVSDTKLRTANLREGSLNALGLGSKVTGGHYDVVIVDDWVTLDNARTETQRQRLADFWNFTVKSTCEPWCRVWGAGTRYHPADWYHTVKQWVDQGVWSNIRRTPALHTGDDGVERSYWPSFISAEELYKYREEMGQIAFSTQYQNEVDLMRGSFFRPEHVENFAEWGQVSEADKRKARHFVSLDPAVGGGPRNDWSVFTVMSYVAPYAYVRRVVRGQWMQRDLEQKVAELHREYNPEAFGIEVVTGFEWLIQTVKQDQPGVRVRALKPVQFRGGDKLGRANQVRKFFEAGRVKFEPPDRFNGIERLHHEMMAFPEASSQPGMDDCVDSLVWALLLLNRPKSRLIKLHSRRSF